MGGSPTLSRATEVNMVNDSTPPRDAAVAGHGEGSCPTLASLRLERVRNADHELLTTLETYDQEAFGATGLRIYDLAVMAEAGAVFVARLGEEIVGGCQVMRMLDEPDFFYVVGFYIRPQWQGRHLGSELLRLLGEESRRLGAAGLMLTVAPENHKALSLYRRHGFVEERFVPHFYGKKEDRHILRWSFSRDHADSGSRGDLPGSV